jgi:hypothetical protein
MPVLGIGEPASAFIAPDPGVFNGTRLVAQAQWRNGTTSSSSRCSPCLVAID